MIVYLITVENGKCYIGITKNDTPSMRLREHHSSIQPIGRAIRKYGIKSVEIIGRASNWDDLCILEIGLINKYGTKKPNGYNLTAGGEGSLGHRPSKETRAKMSKRLKGNKHLQGWKPSEETREKWRTANRSTKNRNAASKGLREKWKDPIWANKMRAILRRNNERKRNAATCNQGVEIS